MDFSKYSPSEQAEVEKIIQQKQIKDLTTMYSNLVERCFIECCHNFTSRELGPKELNCVNNCADKFLKHTERVGERFAEYHAEFLKKQQR